MDKIRENIQRNFDDGKITVEEFIKANIQLSFVEDLVEFVKGGQRAAIGEIRAFGGRDYIKTTSGWKFHGKGTGVKAQGHAAGAKDAGSSGGASGGSTGGGAKPPSAPAAKKEEPKSEPKAEPKKVPAMTKEQIESEIYKLGLGRARDGALEVEVREKGFHAYIPTDDRGARTDHGGGPSGDGWMDGEQIERERAPYVKKYKAKLDAMKEAFEKKGYDTQVYLDYGEKGHIALQVSATYNASKAPKLPKGDDPTTTAGAKRQKLFDDITKKFKNEYSFRIKKNEWDTKHDSYSVRFGQFDEVSFHPTFNGVSIHGISGSERGIQAIADAFGVRANSTGIYGVASIGSLPESKRKMSKRDLIKMMEVVRDDTQAAGKAYADYIRRGGSLD